MADNRDRPYTVAELISDLQKLPPDMRVMVPGERDGYYDAGAPNVTKVCLNVHSEEYYGPHGSALEHQNEASIDVAVL